MGGVPITGFDDLDQIEFRQHIQIVSLIIPDQRVHQIYQSIFVSCSLDPNYNHIDNFEKLISDLSQHRFTAALYIVRVVGNLTFLAAQGLHEPLDEIAKCLQCDVLLRHETQQLEAGEPPVALEHHSLGLLFELLKREICLQERDY